MANFQPAVTLTLEREGGFLHNFATGEIVNHGITLEFVRRSGYKPEADEEFIRGLSIPEATAIYQTYFWDAYRLGSIRAQCVANKAFDLTVNMGPTALKLLQSAVNACGGWCAIDGILGPVSLAQINGLEPERLLLSYKLLAAERYRKIATSNAALAGDLSGWIERLNA